MASRMESEIWSAILSGCPSVTDSDVIRCRPLRLMPCAPSHPARAGHCVAVPRTLETVKSSRSSTRVETIVDRAQPRVEDVCVDLRRRQIGVAEHQLNRAEVGAALEQVRREGVAQDVRTQRPRQLRGARVALQDLPEPDTAQRTAARVHEQARRRAPLHQLWARARLVFLNPVARLLA